MRACVMVALAGAVVLTLIATSPGGASSRLVSLQLQASNSAYVDTGVNLGLSAKAVKLKEPLEIQTNGGVMGIKG